MVAESVIEQQRREFGGAPASQIGVQASGNYQPSLQAGLVINLTLVGNIIIGQPVLFNPAVGTVLYLVMTQDGTGSRTVSFASCWRDIPAGWAAGGTAGQIASGEFRFDGASWQCVGGSSAFASPGIAINVGTAQLSLVPSAPGLYSNPAPSTGSASMTGVAPTIIRGTSTVITPTVGGMTTAGVAGSMNSNITPPDSPNTSLVMQGQQPILTHV
jgi:hypothetical protein